MSVLMIGLTAPVAIIYGAFRLAIHVANEMEINDRLNEVNVARLHAGS